MARFAEERDLERVVELRRQVSAVRAAAMVEHLKKHAGPYGTERSVYYVSEFCVEETYRRRGLGGELLAFLREDAKARGFGTIELDVWEFNRRAVDFYEAAGFRTVRRFMEWETGKV